MARASRSRPSTTQGAEGAAKRAGPIGAPKRVTAASRTYTSQPLHIDFAGSGHRFVRADLEIRGIYHGEASYEGRVFFNNPSADARTPRDAEHGYAGSFHIFGHGGCFGDVGHCDVNEHNREVYDFRSPHPLTPATKRINVTKALKEQVGTDTVTVTVVPVITAANELCDTNDVFRCEDIRIVTYNET